MKPAKPYQQKSVSFPHGTADRFRESAQRLGLTLGDYCELLLDLAEGGEVAESARKILSQAEEMAATKDQVRQRRLAKERGQDASAA